jgi:hypothetical protein
LISWIEYVDRHKQHPFTLGRFPPVPPTEYFSWNFEQKANWQIERFFTFCVKWLEDWLDYIEHDNRIDIKITTFEDMVSDPLGFFRDVINFYNNDPNGFQQNNVLPINACQYHFTSEDNATWKSRLTEEQKAIITAMMSDRLFEVFGWER